MSNPSANGIVARAFRLLKELPPQSLNENTEAAAAARQEIQPAIDYCLLQGDWSFASVIATLAETATGATDPDHPHAYRLPVAVIRLQHVEDGVRYRIDADYLRADKAETIRLRYTARLTDENKMPADFQSAVSHYLASLLAPRLVGSVSRGRVLGDMASDLLMLARKSDSRSASMRRHDGRDPRATWADQALAR